MATPPTDYPPRPAPDKTGARFPWLPIVLALLVPTVYAVWLGDTMSNRLDVLAQDVEDNGVAISTTPSTFVPRPELNAMFETINVKISNVQVRLEENSQQSERQTAQILRSLDRLSRAPP